MQVRITHKDILISIKLNKGRKFVIKVGLESRDQVITNRASRNDDRKYKRAEQEIVYVKGTRYQENK